MHQRKLEPRWMSTFVACEAALQLSRELLCWLCSARAVKSIQENSQDDSCTRCARGGCRDLTEGVKRGAVMSFPAALWCGRSITSSFIYPWQGYLACHCRFFILGEHVCVRYRKFILFCTEQREGGVQQVDAVQADTRSTDWGMGARAGSFPARSAENRDCTRQGDLSSVRQSLRLIYVQWGEMSQQGTIWYWNNVNLDRFWGLAVTQVMNAGKEGTREITDLCRC